MMPRFTRNSLHAIIVLIVLVASYGCASRKAETEMHYSGEQYPPTGADIAQDLGIREIQFWGTRISADGGLIGMYKFDEKRANEVVASLLAEQGYERIGTLRFDSIHEFPGRTAASEAAGRGADLYWHYDSRDYMHGERPGGFTNYSASGSYTPGQGVFAKGSEGTKRYNNYYALFKCVDKSRCGDGYSFYTEPDCKVRKLAFPDQVSDKCSVSSNKH